MNIKDTLLKDFVNAVNTKPEKKTAMYYGEIVEVSDDSGVKKAYVHLDGSESDIKTPIVEGTEVLEGDRVLVTIENHQAVVLANITSPASARTAKNYMDLSEADEGLVIGALNDENNNYNVLIKADGVYIRDGQDVMAIYGGDGTYIYADGEPAAEFTAEGIQFFTDLANYAKFDPVTGEFTSQSLEYLHLDNLEANFAHITEGVIDNATIDHANINDLEANYAHITDGVIDNATIDHADINDLEANYAHITEGVIDNAKIGYADVENLEANYAHITQGVIDNAKIGYADVENLESNYAHITNGTIDNAKIGYADVNDLNAHYASITNGVITNATIDQAKVNNLQSNYAHITNGFIDNADIKEADVENLTSKYAHITNGYIDNADIKEANVENLTSKYAHITQGVIDNAKIGYADVNGLNAHYAEIDMANVNNAWIENGVVKDAAISDAQIIGVSANKLTAGTIDANNINVANLRAKNLIVEKMNGQPILGGYELVNKNSTGYSGKNPRNEGWYEYSNGTFTASTDTTVDMSKAYYKDGNQVALYDQDYIDGLENNLQQQIDGAVQTYTGTAVPTLVNYPAVDWTSAQMANHVGDIYYVVNAGNQYDGYSYRFAYDNTSSTYSWVLIRDSGVTAALADISDLQTFQSNTESWITETDDGLETIRTNHTSLSGVVNKTVKSSTQLWFTKANTTAPTAPNSTTYPNGVTSTSTAGNDWRTVVPTYNASYPYYFYCWQYKYVDNTFGWSAVIYDQATTEAEERARTGVANAATADGKAVSAQNTANANIKSSVQLWFTKANTTAPSKPSSQITNNSATGSNSYNKWNLVVPVYNSSYPYYYYCYQQQKGDGTYQWSDVVYDQATSEAMKKAQEALPASTFTTFESTTFKNVKDTVDEQSSTITNLSSRVDTKADSSTVTTLSNTVNSVSQTATSNSSKLSQLTTTLGTNADGTTKTGDVMHRMTAQEQDLSGFKTTVSQTYTTKTEFNNLEIGGTNLLLSSGNLIGWNKEGGVTVDWDSTVGMYVVDCTSKTQSNWGIYQDVVVEPNAEYTMSVTGQKATDVTIGFGMRFYTTSENRGWPSTDNTFTATASRRTSTQTSGELQTICRMYLFVTCTSTSANNKGYFIHPKLEKGNRATDWSPSPNDYSTTTQMESAITQKANEISLNVSETYTTREDFENLRIGGQNLFGFGSDCSESLTGMTTNGFEIITEDGFKCAHASGAMGASKYMESKIPFVPKPKEPMTISAWVKIKNIVYGTGSPSPMCEFYVSGQTIDGAWRSYYHVKTYVDGSLFDEDIGASQLFTRLLSDTNWHKVEFTFNWGDYNFTTNCLPAVYLRNATGDLYVRDIKYERGTRATDWSPAPEDLEKYADTAVTSFASRFSVTPENISSEVTSLANGSTISSRINQTANNVKIQASKVEIDGTAVFNAISSDVDSAITGKGYQTASQVSTAISNTSVSDLSDGSTYAKKSDALGAVTTKDQYYLSTSSSSATGGSWQDSVPTWSSGKYIWTRVATTKTPVSGNASTTYSTAVYDSALTSALSTASSAQSSANSAASTVVTTKQYYLSTATSSATGGSWGDSVPTWASGKYIWVRFKIVKTPVSGTATTTYSPSENGVYDSTVTTALSTAYTANAGLTDKADKTAAVSETQRIYYRSNAESSGVPVKPNGNGLPTTWVTETGDKYNSNATTSTGWSRKVTPISNGTGSSVTKYLYLWTCIQKKTVSGTVTYGDILLDDSTTVIDGGKIITGSVSANSINASSGTFDVANIPDLNASKITAGTISVNRIPDGALNSNVQVGGTNLLLDTGDLTKWNKEVNVSVEWDSTEGMYKIVDSSHTSSRWGIYKDVAVEPNTTYTCSMTGKKAEYDIGFGVASQATSTYSGYPNTCATYTTTKDRLSYTFTTGADHVLARMYICIYPTAAGSYGYALKPKIEKGNKATDWSPAPEDVQTEIDSKKSVHTLNSNYSSVVLRATYTQILGWSAEGKVDNWNVTSTSGVKVGDTVRIALKVSDFSDAIVYLVTTVTAVNSAINISTISHGLDSTVIDGGRILANSIGANQIKANSISADKIVVSDFNNYITSTENDEKSLADGYISDGWIAKKAENNNLWLSPVISQWTRAGEKYRLTGKIKAPAAGTARVYIYGRDSSGTAISSVTHDSTITLAANTEKIINEVITISNDVASQPKANIAIYFWDSSNNWQGGFCKQMKLERMSGGELIVDGSLTIGAMSAEATKSILNHENLFGYGSQCESLNGFDSSGFEIITEDGFKCAHASGALTTTKYLCSLIKFVPKPKETVTISAYVKIKNIVYGTTNPMCEFYIDGQTINGAWRSATINAVYVDGVPVDTINGLRFPTYISDTNWHHIAFVRTWENYTFTNKLGGSVYLRDCTGDLYVRNIKYERGNTYTDWTPAPMDLETQWEAPSSLIANESSTHCTMSTSGNNITITRITTGSSYGCYYDMPCKPNTFYSASIRVISGSDFNITFGGDYGSGSVWSGLGVSHRRTSNGKQYAASSRATSATQTYLRIYICSNVQNSTMTFTDLTVYEGDDIGLLDRGAYNASLVATNYVTEINSDGIWVTPSGKKPSNTSTGAGATGAKIDGTNGFGIWNNGVNVAQYGTSARIGSETSGHVNIASSGMQVYGSSGTTLLANIGYGAGNKSGGGTADAPYYSLGTRTGSIGNYSVAEGYGTTAQAYASHSEGSETVASGESSHSEGLQTLASNGRAHAEGEGSEATGLNSHAEGTYTHATQSSAHSEGYMTYATGQYSHAQNEGTTAQGKSQTVIGRYNVAQGTADSYAATDHAFIIGNGTSSTPSNALTVDWSGNVNAKGGYKVNNYTPIVVETVTADNITINGNSLYTWDKTGLSKTGYTLAGVIGFGVTNATTSGSNSSLCTVYYCRKSSASSIQMLIRNTGSASSASANTYQNAKVKLTADLLWVATGMI